MIVFDLSMITDIDSKISCMTAILYDEFNPSFIKRIGPVPGKRMVRSIATEIYKKYSNHFPSLEQLVHEIEAVHNLNMVTGKNQTGVDYPLYVEG